jgi:hypothetical protein
MVSPQMGSHYDVGRAESSLLARRYGSQGRNKQHDGIIEFYLDQTLQIVGFRYTKADLEAELTDMDDQKTLEIDSAIFSFSRGSPIGAG